jgi:hypothetical protein
MRLAHRKLGLFAVAVLVLVAAGCGGNKDKLVGKWKIDSISGKGAEGFTKMMEAAKIFFYFEFGKDDTVKMGADSNDPTVKAELAKEKDKEKPTSGKYKVSGDMLEFVDMGDKADKSGPLGKKDEKIKMKFDGNDKLSFSGSDGTMNLSRIK